MRISASRRSPGNLRREKLPFCRLVDLRVIRITYLELLVSTDIDDSRSRHLGVETGVKAFVDGEKERRRTRREKIARFVRMNRPRNSRRAVFLTYIAVLLGLLRKKKKRKR